MYAMNRKLKSLKHCNLTNTVVTVFYDTPFDLSYVVKTISKAYDISKMNVSEYPLANTHNAVNQDDKVICLANNKYKVIIERGRLSFNIVQNYISWNEYREFIAVALDAIPKQEILFKSAGVNYISAFPNIRLFDALKGSVHLDCYDDVFGAELRYPIISDGCKGFVRITNLLPQGKVNVSFMDITIIQENSVRSVAELWPILENVHDKEKEELIKIVTEEFLNELGAEYE